MADAMVERRPTVRFFCHRCNIEFEDVLQDYRCPFCSSGFIEQLENDTEAAVLSNDFSDADMSNIDDMSNLGDSDEVHVTQGPPPMLNELAFLMSGGRTRGAGRRETLMEHLVWMIGGARPGSGAVTAGAPFVLVGAPGDYVFGGEGLDAVVTQLLGQLENAGPPPLPRDRIAALPSEQLTEAQITANVSCSVCWENFQIGETVSRLECDHIFHSTCITPWLQLHATCPICRRSLLPDEPVDLTAAPVTHADSNAPPANTNTTTTTTAATTATAATTTTTNTNTTPTVIDPRITMMGQSANLTNSIPALLTRLLLRQDQRRRVLGPLTPTWDLLGDTSSSAGTASTGTSVTGSNSTASLDSNERERRYNMDIDYD